MPFSHQQAKIMLELTILIIILNWEKWFKQVWWWWDLFVEKCSPTYVRNWKIASGFLCCNKIPHNDNLKRVKVDLSLGFWSMFNSPHCLGAVIRRHIKVGLLSSERGSPSIQKASKGRKGSRVPSFPSRVLNDQKTSHQALPTPTSITGWQLSL